MEIENLKTYDPWDVEKNDIDRETVNEQPIHIRVQQRTGRKSLTTVQGLARDLNLKKILKVFKKEFSCNGTIIRSKEMGKIIQVQGDQRENISNFLKEENICMKESIKIHGF